VFALIIKTNIDLVVDGIIHSILSQKAEHGLDSSCSGMGAVEGPSEHGNEFSGSIKCGEIVDCLTNQSG
jgi:hypothetical protein